MAVIGAGIVGLALAREITRRLPEVDVSVFDKAERVAAHQSGHTSGIVEPGLDAEPGSQEAELARRGVQLLVPFVSERGIPYRECGQLLVAQNTDEADRLEGLLARAEANGVPGVRLLDRRQMREIEPNARGVLALYSPHTAVTDFTALTEALASDARAAGGTFRFGTEVTGLDVMSNEVRVRIREADPETREDSPEPRDDAAEPRDDDRDIDEQVHEGPRTYHGEDADGPVIDFRDELRSRFGEQDWFKQVEDTIGGLADRFSNPASGRDRSRDGSQRTRSDDAAEEGFESFDLVIVCAGLQADRMAADAGFDDDPRIVPFTSDCCVVDAALGGDVSTPGRDTGVHEGGASAPEGDAGAAGSEASPTAPDEPAEVVRGIIGTVPDPASPLSAKSVVRDVNGVLTLGPNTFVSLGRERYDRRGFDFGDVGSTVGFKGFWKFAAQSAKTAAHGAKPTVSTSAFVAEIRKFVPAIDPSALRQGVRGVRAQAMDADGTLVDELRVSTRGRLTMVRSLPRSGATSALAIAEHIADSVLEAPTGSTR
ncbi:hypothetical protein GCM10009813_15460 [Brevibacterium marinum]